MDGWCPGQGPTDRPGERVVRDEKRRTVDVGDPEVNASGLVYPARSFSNRFCYWTFPKATTMKGRGPGS